MSSPISIHTLKEAVEIVRNYLESLFPKTCPNCNKVYSSYREFLLETKSEGDPIDYDDEYDELTNHKEPIPKKPIGICMYYQCNCGSTLALSSLKMPVKEYLKLLLWGRKYRKEQGLSLKEFMHLIQSKVNQYYLIGEFAEKK